jgi:hypothetical protein
MPRRPVRATSTPESYRPISTVTPPKVGEIFFYIGRCRFMKTDHKPRVRIVTIYTYHSLRVAGHQVPKWWEDKASAFESRTHS